MSLLKSFGFKVALGIVVLTVMTATNLGSRSPVVSAHPLGNFTINHYSRINLTTDAVSLRYILDMAEVPTFQEISRIDTDKDNHLSESERSSYLENKLRELEQQIHLSINESPLVLTVAEQGLSLPPGQGGLPTLRLSFLFQGRMSNPNSVGEQVIEFRDENYPQRIGWKEIVVQTGDGIILLDSTAPQTDLSNELQAYPTDLKEAQPDQTHARAIFVHASAGSLSNIQSPKIADEARVPSEDLLSSLIANRELSLPLMLVSFLVALGLGALHAISPGHGKTIIAAYLVGAKGTAKHAIFLGMTVTVSHTLGVVVLGLVVLYASNLIAPEVLYPWLGVASGVIIIAIGLGLLWNRVRPGRTHSYDEHPHHHPHPHDHHHFGPQNSGKLGITWRSLAALGVVGGLVPSTSALVILLVAISMQRVGLGLMLVLAFSAGMALVLGGVGLALVYAARTVERVGIQKRWLAGITREISIVAAAVVLVSGLVMMARGLLQLGLG